MLHSKYTSLDTDARLALDVLYANTLACFKSQRKKVLNAKLTPVVDVIKTFFFVNQKRSNKLENLSLANLPA
jgi:hypothetical protein